MVTGYWLIHTIYQPCGGLVFAFSYNQTNTRVWAIYDYNVAAAPAQLGTDLVQSRGQWKMVRPIDCFSDEVYNLQIILKISMDKYAQNGVGVELQTSKRFA